MARRQRGDEQYPRVTKRGARQGRVLWSSALSQLGARRCVAAGVVVWWLVNSDEMSAGAVMHLYTGWYGGAGD